MVSKAIIVLVSYVNMDILCNSMIESLTVSFKIYHLCNFADLVVCEEGLWRVVTLYLCAFPWHHLVRSSGYSSL